MRAGRDWSIITRITVFAGAVATLLSALLAVSVMLAIHKYVTQDHINEIAVDGGRVAHEIEHDGVHPLIIEEDGRDLQVVDATGKVVASTPRLRGQPPMADFTPLPKAMASNVVCGGVFPDGDCRLVVAQSAYRAGQDWVVYSSGRTIPLYVAPWLSATVFGAAALMAAAITVLGHRIVTTAIRPVNTIRAELEAIGESSPQRRVPLPPTHDEIHDLAESVNRTLARLHAAMSQQRNFTSNASHELRTPITAIRAEVEDALVAPEETTVRKLGEAVLVSVNRIETIVGDLLAIARLEAAQPVDGEPVDLATLVSAKCRDVPGRRKAFDCALQPGVVVTGDPSQLSRLLTNLLDNAERHAAGTVTVRVSHEPASGHDAKRFPMGVALLEVIDDGPGIEPDKRELVFQRFARLDTARDRNTGGSGLGLVMARKIAHAHGGTLRVEDSTAGARFVLRLPLAAVPVTAAPRGRT
ncbi:HAMP domain-containing sensor histidine kinase [Nonomuraea sp. NPDC048882]|uniref:sensor histidine kinase n=1 Tax=unclassified Nonomuraea TaxID=2593643 RepID=UPI000A46857F